MSVDTSPPTSSFDASAITSGTIAAARLANPYGLQHPAMRSGDVYEMADFYGATRILLTAGPALTADRVYFFPIIVKQAVTITLMSFQVTTAVAASNARMGFYADSGGVPTGAALLDTGNMSTASTAVVDSSAVSYAMPLGPLWWALAVSGAVGFNGYNGGGVPLIGASTTGDASQYNAYRMTNAYGALPTVGSLTRVSVSAPPRFQVKL